MDRSSSGVVFLLLICSFYSSLSFSFSVFMRKEEASKVLRISKRANSFFEEISPGNLERECIEEICSFEEAKEIFKSQEKTMEFWFAYKDLNPCKENPCKNGGICKIKHYLSSCTCPPRYGGSLCELEKSECWYKNGGCWQYCQDIENSLHVACSCARGYTLIEDGKSCTPSDRFPCGLVRKSTRSSGGRSNKHDQLNGWNMTENVTDMNQTEAQENLDSWNQTVVQEGIEEEDLEQIMENVTEGNFQSWMNINYTDESNDPRIVGGSFCRPGECPWQVQIQTKRGYGFCGGSLISRQWVLTAAHCLDTVIPHQVTVGDFDKHQRERDEQKVGVQRYQQHPQYNPENYNNDIALIQLTSSVAFSQNVFPICLPNPNLATLLLEGQEPGRVSGWGATHTKGRSTRFLMKVSLPMVTMDICRQTTDKLLTENMFCAGYATKAKDACKGDSGGPFAVAHHDTWYLMGIVSWGEGCAEEGKYGAYTRVSNYLSWIKEVIESVTEPGEFLYVP
ncbi:coagulation factor X-like [Tiliqua scincoides]|uniref:coagulation factor X-like n=1 Tax=Tiliqua scincoides TaxID=71010 RepID=UPI0034638092